MSFDRESEYGEDTRRALAHIAGRTQQGSFAAPLYDWSAERWAAAVEPLERAGVVESAIATAADDPTVTRGWALAQPVQLDVLDRQEAWDERGAPDAAYERYEGPLGWSAWLEQEWRPAREADGRQVLDEDLSPEALATVDGAYAVREQDPRDYDRRDGQQTTRQESTINSATTADTGHYGSHDVTPRERES